MPFDGQRPHAPQRARRAGRRAGDRRRARRAVDVALSRLRGQRIELPAASSSSTTATTPTRCRCAPPSTISPRPRPGAASPCSATCSSSGPTSARFHAEIGEHARAAGVDLLVTVGPLRRAAGRRASASATPCADAQAAAARASRGCSAPGDTVLVKALARRRPRGRRRGAGRRVMGEVLIAGTASLLICVFLSPTLHRLPARPRVRPAHPRGGPRGPPREGRHADDGRDHHLPRDLGRRS